MKIYISAFVGALFLMLMAGLLVEGVVWAILSAFHASKTVLLTAEAFMLAPLLVMFGFTFKSTLSTERELAEQGY
ncbi:hypothetical protein [Litorimonas sp. WD9-15]|uniref:hypothetical protein n=1 Tax=Litorimonas sp. WD9-15 TaxID=3418716 RepID=UPI003CFD9593